MTEGGRLPPAGAALAGGRRVDDFTALLPGDAQARWNANVPVGTGQVVTWRFGEGGEAVDLPGGGTAPGRAVAGARQGDVRHAFDHIAAVAGITFVELAPDDGRAMISLQRADAPGFAGWAYWPAMRAEGYAPSQVVIEGAGDLAPGSAGYATLLHELGHALGLKHPFETMPRNPALLSEALDDRSQTVMSYSDGPGAAPPDRLGPLDVDALRFLYGAGAGPEAYADDAFVHIRGGAGADVLQAAGAASAIRGRRGDDALVGGAEGDFLFGGAGGDLLRGLGGDDTLRGGRGADTLWGGRGDDRLVGGGGGDRLGGGAGADVLIGRAGTDVLTGHVGRDVLAGGKARDVLVGGAGADVLRGGAGHDVLRGGDGRDVLRGGTGHDTLRGGDGRDVLAGGPGRDLLAGGAGADRFVFAPGEGGWRDRVADFGGRDVLDLRAFDVDFDDLRVAEAPGGTLVRVAGTQVLLVGHDAPLSEDDVLL